MHDRTRRPHVQHLLVPIETLGWYVDVTGLSLSRGSDSGIYHVGLFLRPREETPQPDIQVFASIADAVFLRDSLAEVLADYYARQTGAN